MSDQSELLVPLRSNGNALLTGKPIESVRRRLKFASLSFDQIFLEAGIRHLRHERRTGRCVGFYPAAA